MILVTGGEGQLALALEQAARERGIALRRIGRPEFDFDQPETIAATVETAAPSLVINAAAYTAVDAAETDADAAWRANADGPRLLAEACAAARAPLLHVSTDYVFDGAKGAPYVETDPTAPLGVYGASKLAGETAALAAWPRTIVARTSWVISHTGRNFVRTMLGAARRTDRLRVVADQRGCPTSAEHLAHALLTVAARVEGGWRNEFGGVVHATGSGETTWHGLAEAVFDHAAPLGLRRPTVEPIATADWPTPVRRPADSRLDCTRLAKLFDARLPDWRIGVARIVDRAMTGN